MLVIMNGAGYIAEINGWSLLPLYRPKARSNPIVKQIIRIR